MKNTKITKLVISAMMLALAVVLSLPMFSFKLWPNGGSITLASMVPIIIIGTKYSFKWSLLVALCYSGLQMLMGFYPPPVQDIPSFAIVILFDYVIAFGALGLFPIFLKLFRKRNVFTFGLATFMVTFIRYVCHFISGVTIWKSFAPEEQGAVIYSTLYNGSFMLPEIVISVVVICLLYPTIKKLIKD